MSDHIFLDLPALLEPDDLIVVNETRVRAARLVGRRSDSGGRVELLLLERLPDGSWEALAKPARRLRPGALLEFDDLSVEVIESAVEGKLRLILHTDDPEAAVARAGIVPLPPYFTGHLNDPERYQTMFATIPGSAAAPTAGLHFTDAVLDRLKRRGVGIATVDLHVSLDTFRPMDSEHIEDHRMHTEWCSVSTEAAEAIEATRDGGGRIVAIGTTVVRTLESMADGTGRVHAGERRTELFLRPGSRFSVVDLLVTNFHMPGSTLLVLLAAFMGERWRDAYELALRRGYRFLSFGDAMLAARSTS